MRVELTPELIQKAIQERDRRIAENYPLYVTHFCPIVQAVRAAVGHDRVTAGFDYCTVRGTDGLVERSYPLPPEVRKITGMKAEVWEQVRPLVFNLD